MYTNRSMDWIRRVVGCIRYPPDRKEVEAELYDHIMCRYEENLSLGMGEQEADEAAAAAMGDPFETGRELARIHKPFLGFFLAALRIAAVCALLFAAILLLKYPSGNMGWKERFSNCVIIPVGQSDAAVCGAYRFSARRAAIAPNGTLLFALRYRTANPLLHSPALWLGEATLTDANGSVYTCKYSGGNSYVFGGTVFFFVRTGSTKPERAVFRYDNGYASFALPLILQEGSV